MRGSAGLVTLPQPLIASQEPFAAAMRFPPALSANDDPHGPAVQTSFPVRVVGVAFWDSADHPDAGFLVVVAAAFGAAHPAVKSPVVLAAAGYVNLPVVLAAKRLREIRLAKMVRVVVLDVLIGPADVTDVAERFPLPSHVTPLPVPVLEPLLG